MSDVADLTDLDEDKDRNFITALARGLDVLRSFRDGEVSLTNADFAERTGLPKATVSRLTHTLCALNYLVADPRMNAYRLGAGVLQLGFGVLSGIDIAQRAAHEMRRLRDGPNSYISVALGEQHQLDVVYVAAERSREPVALALRIGSQLPLFDSAIGRALLVGMSDKVREETFLLLDGKLEQGRGRETYAEAVIEFEAKGFCSAYGSWRSDVNGIAVPVFSLGGARTYALNVGGPSSRLKKKQLETVYAKMLFEAAEAISIQAPA